MQPPAFQTDPDRYTHSSVPQPSDLPLRPRFLSELVLIPFGPELMVDGTERMHVLQGLGAQSILPQLVRLMDGRRTLDELTTALPGISQDDILAAISSLWHWGLLEDGAFNALAEPQSNVETLSFLRRYLGFTGLNRSGLEAYEKLRNSEVMIFDSDSASHDAQSLRLLLEKVGVGKITTAVPGSLRDQCKPESVMHSLAVSLSLSGEDCKWHQTLDDWCCKHQLPWLRVVLSKKENYVDFGPLFTTKTNPCYSCFHQVHCEKSRSKESLGNDSPSIERNFWISMAAIEVVYFLSGIGALATAKSFERYDFKQWAPQRLHWLRVPGCLRCRPLPRKVSEAGCHQTTTLVDTAVAFEDYVGLSSRSVLSSVIRENQAHAANLLSKETKRMPNCEQMFLRRGVSRLRQPALEVLRERRQAFQAAIHIDDLATMLMVTSGIRSFDNETKKIQRWAATAGNLGSVELFVAVRNVMELSPGVYFYQAHEHSLAFFQRRTGGLDIPDLMRRSIASDPADLPDAIVIFTGAFHRLQRKYGFFGYKLLNLDAGIAVSQLHLAARALGFRSRTTVRWADDLIEQQLNLDSQEEQCTAVVELRSGARGREAPVFQTSARMTSGHNQPPSAKLPSDFRELPLHDIGAMLYRESRMCEKSLAIQSFQDYPEPQRLRNVSALSLKLPPAASGGRRLISNILSERTTVRAYSRDSVSPDQLAVMLACANEADREYWEREQSSDEPLIFYVLAWRLTGFSAGAYTYDPEDRALRFVGPAASQAERAELFAQAEFASAPVVIWIAGNLAAASGRLGALGHRFLLLRAGFAGHRLWMAAMAMGLAGGVTAGVVPGAARKQFGLDGYHRASLLAFATGMPADRSWQRQRAGLEE
jgi:SagB-type dehydrogenase family enzyme